MGGSRSRPALSRNVLVGSACAVVQITANLVAYPVYLHYLGFKQYGLWLTLSVVLTIVQFVAAGFSPALTQAVARSAASRHLGSPSQYFVWSLIGVVFFWLVLVAGWLASLLVVRMIAFDPEASRAIGALGPLLTLLAAFGLAVECAASVTAGVGRFHEVYVANAVGQVCGLVASVALLAAGAAITALLAGYAVSRSVTAALLMRRILGEVWVRPRLFRPLPAVGADLARTTGVMLGGTLLNVFLLPLNRWFLATAAGLASVPVFEIGYTGSMQIRNIVEFGLRSLVPEVASASAAGAGRTVAEIERRWFRIVVVAGVLLYGAAAVLSPAILKLWLRDHVAPNQSVVLRLCLIAGFLSLAGTPSYYVLIGLRRLGDVFLSYAIQACVNVIAIVAAALTFWPDKPVACSLAMIAAIFCSTAFMIRRSGQATGGRIRVPEGATACTRG